MQYGKLEQCTYLESGLKNKMMEMIIKFKNRNIMSKDMIYLFLNKIDHLYQWILIKLYVKSVSTIMDIGCGKRPEQYIKPKIHYCIDPYLPYLEAIHKTNDRFWILIEGDWKIAIDMMREDNLSINSVFLIDIIEHVEKPIGRRLLRETQELITDQIIVFTPYGYLDQANSPDGKDAWGMDGAKFQEHKSGWYPEDFEDGWKTWVLPYSHVVDNCNNSIPPNGAILAIYNKKDVKK